MTTDEQWLINAAAQHEKDAVSYEKAAFFAALQTFVAQQAERREQLEAEIHGRSWNHEQW